MAERVVLAYCGGLDTSVAVRWLQENGASRWSRSPSTSARRPTRAARTGTPSASRALAAGAVEAVVIDARAEMAEEFCLPALQANARYEGKYPLVSALSRPVIVRHLVAEARRHGATAVAHGCTGKGNDQVRFEVGTRALAPDLEIYAPARVWGLSREDCVELAAKWEIPITVTKEKLYSIDDNLWGKAIECGAIEDPWAPAPDDVYTLTRPTETEAVETIVGFEAGVPVSLDGRALKPQELIARLGVLAGSRGFGRLDMVENRRVGIKSREVYECPAALALIVAHSDLEDLTLERDLHHEKARLEPRWSELVYDGLWFSPLKSALDAFIDESQRHVTGEVRLRFAAPGTCTVVGRRSPVALYDHGLATYDASDTFRHAGRRGFRAAVGSRRGHLVGPPGPGGGRGMTPGDHGPMTLWKGRITPAWPRRVAAFTVSLPFDQVLAHDDLAGSRAHVKGLGKGGILSDDEVDARCSMPSTWSKRSSPPATFAFEPGDEDVHTADRTPGDRAGRRRRAPNCTPAAAATTRSPPTCGCGAAAPLIAVAAEVMASRTPWPAVPPRPATSTCRATPTCNGPSRSCWPTTCWPTAGRWPATSTGWSPRSTGSTSRRSAPVRWPARRSARSRLRRGRARLPRPLRELARCGVRPRLRRRGAVRPRAPRRAPVADGRGAGAVVDRGVRLLHARRRLCHRQLDAAAEEEPRRGRAGPGQDRPADRPPHAVLVTLKGLPLAYNRDLQEDKEPLFDAVRPGHAGADRAARRLRTVDLERGAHAARRPTARPPPPSTWPRCWSSRACPSAAHALVGGLVRESLERHVPLVELVAAHPDLGDAAVVLLEPGVAVTRRRTPGGAGPGPVAEQTERFVRRREVDRTRLAQWSDASSSGSRTPDHKHLTRDIPALWSIWHWRDRNVRHM